jgi:hypothetical protein
MKVETPSLKIPKMKVETPSLKIPKMKVETPNLKIPKMKVETPNLKIPKMRMSPMSQIQTPYLQMLKVLEDLEVGPIPAMTKITMKQKKSLRMPTPLNLLDWTTKGNLRILAVGKKVSPREMEMKTIQNPSTLEQTTATEVLNF